MVLSHLQNSINLIHTNSYHRFDALRLALVLMLHYFSLKV